MKSTSMTIRAIELPNNSEAIQYAEAGGGEAISVWGKSLVVAKSEADRIAAAGVEFAYLHDHEMPDGSHRIMTVPVN